MRTDIDNLVAMRDIETLYELMCEDDDWMMQLDAAEGLVTLGDKRGLDFLLDAKQSDDKDVRDVVKEILEDPKMQFKLAELQSARHGELRVKKESAKKRLQSGRRVFQYKMAYLPASEFLDEDSLGEGFDVPALTEFGLEGWEVVSVIGRRRQMAVNIVDDNISGAYFLLKREVMGADGQELEGL